MRDTVVTLAGDACILAAAIAFAGCSEEQPASCLDTNAECTLRAASEEVGVLMGTTSERAGWSEGELGALVSQHFSPVTTQNELKWRIASAPGVYDFTGADETISFAEQHGIRARGHTLFWHRGSGTPNWVEDELAQAADPEARLRELMAEHVQTVVGRYAGRIETWDVINEPLDLFSGNPAPESIYFQTFERYEDFLDLAFELARQTDPEAKLFLNEIFPSVNADKFQGLLDLVSGMLERGAPIDGVGFQGHFVLEPPERQTLQDRLQAFADLGLLVEITELDVSIRLTDDQPEPLAGQAEIYRTVVEACLAVATCVGITTWNIHDGLTWLDRSPPFDALAPHSPTLFDEDLMPKPAYDATVDAFLNRLSSRR